MNTPEFVILAINAIIIVIAYFFVYPRFCGANTHRIAVNDLIASGVAVAVAGSKFWGSGTEFSLLFWSVNWFWFSLLTYLVIEIPLMLWYARKHNIRTFFDPH